MLWMRRFLEIRVSVLIEARSRQTQTFRLEELQGATEPPFAEAEEGVGMATWAPAEVAEAEEEGCGVPI